ncbi:MAG: PTS sugar transporter subunit IIA [Deltaproteobacteria bacterium]|nr:PTS sugar transporter subunit IIA [Deltaproteobacteria bacterium]MBW1965991.1 PTS sugar transporter subunit IIA [Deltaproteobacteria bacterium]MBW2097387.1 PTS sugar transporter subunit IIA [Deltaproteobacteria bacterium]PXF54659.1 MAG: PTS fructose transporter subunit IIA [Deltaproteobacteria bacterium]RKX57923.1 MAG: PTS sugar transporter subunit IIA [Thermodesulfobacteriota bacterium]
MTVKIIDFLCNRCIIPNLNTKSKEDALVWLTKRVVEIEPALDQDAVLSVLREREQLGSTGIGGGVAIPHGKLRGLGHMLIVVGRSPDGIPFDAMDNLPVHIVFLLLAPDNSATLYLKVLAQVSRLLKTREVYQRIMKASDELSIQKVIEEMDGQV